MTLGERIQELRRARGLSQEGLGEKLGVSRQAVSRWEMDGAVPEVDKLVALSRIFGVDLNDLLQVESPAPGPEKAREKPAAEGGGKKEHGRGRLPVRPVLLVLLPVLLASVLFLGWSVRALSRQLTQLELRIGRLEEAAAPALDPEQPLVVGFDVEYYLMQRDEALICYTFTVTAARQTEGMELELEVVDENGEAYTLPLELVNGSVYRGELEMRYPAGSDATVSALVRDGLGRSYTQPVAKLSGMGEETEQIQTLWGSP